MHGHLGEPYHQPRNSYRPVLKVSPRIGRRFNVRVRQFVWVAAWLAIGQFLTAAAMPAHAQPQTIAVLIESNLQVASMRFLQRLTENLPTEARENIHFVPALSPSSEIQERLRESSWNLAILSTVTLEEARIRTAAVAFDMPFLFSDLTTVTRLQQSPLGQAGLSTMSEQGMTGLVYLNAGFTLVADRKRLETPNDLRGRKVAVLSPSQAEPFKRIGSVPVFYKAIDASSAVEKGAVDSVAINSVNDASWVFPEKGFLLTDSVRAQVAVVVTQDKSWPDIPFIYRAMIGDAAIAASLSIDRSLV
jgi:TRAP-type C4-dicarboxylate transport system substrate-binding protein